MFPTIEMCVNLDDAEREILARLDQQLRAALINVYRELAAAEVDGQMLNRACVTVLMSVAADAALDARLGVSGASADCFRAVGADAFTWAKKKRRLAFAS